MKKKLLKGPLPATSCSSSSFFDRPKLGDQCLSGGALNGDQTLRIGSQADLDHRSPGATDTEGGNVVDADPGLHGDGCRRHDHPFGVSDAEKLGERHVLVWLRDQLQACGGKSLAFHHTDVFHGNTKRLLAFMELLGRRVTLVDGKECLITMRGPWLDVSWTNSFIHRPVGIAPCSPTGRRTGKNPTGKYGIPGKSFMVGTLAPPRWRSKGKIGRIE
jgi:hypothetical protein